MEGSNWIFGSNSTGSMLVGVPVCEYSQVKPCEGSGEGLLPLIGRIGTL